MTTRQLICRLVPLFVVLAGCSDDTSTDTASVQPPVDAPPPVVETATPAAAAPQAVPEARPAASDGPQEIEWDALIPDDYRPDKLMAEFNIDELSDDDPRAAELMVKLRELWDQAPVREELDGTPVRLPGFVVPVEADANETTSFLLVPYYGACVHVPPPPANQTVYVVTEAGKGAAPGLFDVVWVSGTMSVKRIDNDIAEAGYTLYATDIAPYE